MREGKLVWNTSTLLSFILTHGGWVPPAGPPRRLRGLEVEVLDESPLEAGDLGVFLVTLLAGIEPPVSLCICDHLRCNCILTYKSIGLGRREWRGRRHITQAVVIFPYESG